MSTPIVEQIRSTARPTDSATLRAEVRAHIDDTFSDLDALLAGPSVVKRGVRRKRGLKEEISYWQEREAIASKELEETSRRLPILLEETQTKLEDFLSSAQSLSLERYALADKLAGLVSELSSEDDHDRETQGRRKTVLEQLEEMQDELKRLEAGLAWATVLERVLLLSEITLNPSSHLPSALAALPKYAELHELVLAMESTLPSQMSLLRVIRGVQDKTWIALKDIMSQALLKACIPLKWPLRVQYHDISPTHRRDFENAYKDLLYLQIEGEKLHGSSTRPPQWYSGEGLYPLQAMVQPIALRFKYHFQGKRDTNRVDKPEWAFANILDQIYDHQAFIGDYLQPLTNQAGYDSVDVKSELTMLLFPCLLSLLRTRIPHLLEHPALLAHTIYQTVVFDDAIREGGFDVDNVSINEGIENGPWEGLAGVLLREEGWFDQWLAGEKKFADGQLNEIISSTNAWDISDELSDGEEGLSQAGLKPTVSSRQVKALFEQIQDRYSPLPSLEYKLPFLTSIQLPILAAYHGRISGSLDAFENLSSAFVRAVPGALSGNTRSGVHIDQTKLTSGSAGLERLIKACVSGAWILAALRTWADDLFFVEMSQELSEAPQLRWRLASDTLLPTSLRTGTTASDNVSVSVSVFDVLVDRYSSLSARAEDMIVRLVTVEVENDLKPHLTRRWDQDTINDGEPDPSLLGGITTLSSHLSILNTYLPILVVSRLYRRIIQHLVNHISQRAVYSGWSKFTFTGGQSFAQEINDFIQACSSVLPDLPSGVEGSWIKLKDAGKILGLPNEQKKEPQGITFNQVMAGAWDGDESFKRLCERLGWEKGRMTKNELQALLKRRVDCWR
ncbi:TIP-1 family-domain-containing protein [Naematelia encephala]|uniref:TIP-1 family-domain-containing protein n=1 Tax=Naematelia encephala TaxID=71784 RepID=A0A1Y2BGG2_9TREE|nr:TIP-1 family-domain-containing protein [Naematelia encephala]